MAIPGELGPLGAGATCGSCGFRYWEHKGHIIPCPVCALAALQQHLLYRFRNDADSIVNNLGERGE